MRKNQGFSNVAIVIAALAIVVAGLVTWRIIDANNNAKDKNQAQQANQNNQPNSNNGNTTSQTGITEYFATANLKTKQR